MANGCGQEILRFIKRCQTHLAWSNYCDIVTLSSVVFDIVKRCVKRIRHCQAPCQARLKPKEFDRRSNVFDGVYWYVLCLGEGGGQGMPV